VCHVLRITPSQIQRAYGVCFSKLFTRA
jgi:hypothetical protein